MVDHGDRAAGPGREAPGQDGPDIGLARVGDDALVPAPRDLDRLTTQQARLSDSDSKAGVRALSWAGSLLLEHDPGEAPTPQSPDRVSRFERRQARARRNGP
tara:strand:- start:1179 stop:1484 length:306 start_codon:yes stop_codon:yes gene_type:complete